MLHVTMLHVHNSPPPERKIHTNFARREWLNSLCTMQLHFSPRAFAEANFRKSLQGRGRRLNFATSFGTTHQHITNKQI